MTKLLSCRYNMDTNQVEARFEDGTTLAIDCIAVEDEYGNTPAQRAELDWLLYVQSPLPCKDLLGNIPNPLTVQPPPGAALQLHDSVDLNKIAA